MNSEKPNSIDHRQIDVNGVSVHVAESGNPGLPTILFLHGYPENWRTFEKVMIQLKDVLHVVAIDLPGIGTSDVIASGDKRSIAKFVNDVADRLNYNKFILAGHDIGGMVTYAFLRLFPERLARAIIMNTAIPGIEPWEEVKRNPHIWHFAFYAVPSLPETLAMGKQRPLFDYFYDTLSANKTAIPETDRNEYANAYGKASSLKTSFDWYRAFVQDEKDNAPESSVEVPVLYLRGDKEFGDINNYASGFRKKGLVNIMSKLIPSCGHFACEEQPEAVAGAIQEFVKT